MQNEGVAHKAPAPGLEELKLEPGVAARGRDDGGAEQLAAVVNAEAAREQSVAIGVVKHITRDDSGDGQCSSVALGEDVDVAPAVADHRRFAAGAGAGMDAHGVVERDCQHAVGVRLAEIGLLGERQAVDVADRCDRADVDICQLGSPIRRWGRLHAVEQRNEPLALERLLVGGRHRLDLRLEHIGGDATSLPRPTGRYPMEDGTISTGAAITLEDLTADPHPANHRLRAHEPVAWVEVLGGWLVTSRDLAIQVMRDDERFTVDDPRFTTGQVVGPSMLSLDGDVRRRHRDPFAEAFRDGSTRTRVAEFMDVTAVGW